MTLDEYQKKAQGTVIYPALGGQGWVYPALGLAGEAGEVADKLKKVVRDHNGEITPEIRELVKGELGDVLWYVSQLARELDFTLEEIAQGNIDKLASRQKRQKLSGSGDSR
jgi:NTP pyrophosphatase (non-canonical NTP hydrolase)